MRNDLARLLTAMVVLVSGGALEELLPKPWGCGFPLLLSAVLAVVPRRETVGAVLFAIAAGAVEDALSSLPFAVSVAYFAATAALVRGYAPGRWAGLLAFPLFQLWLACWGQVPDGAIFTRLLVSVPVGAAACAAVEAAVGWLDRRAVVA